MTIELYQNNSRDNARSKDLTLLASLNGTLRNETSIIDPKIRIAGSVPHNCNYLYIPEFHRYYFVNDVVSMRNGLYELSAHCDVLTSAGSGLDSCSGIVRRQENNWNLYLDDGVFKAYSNPNVVQKSFPSGFTGSLNYILAVAGS